MIQASYLKKLRAEEVCLNGHINQKIAIVRGRMVFVIEFAQLVAKKC